MKGLGREIIATFPLPMNGSGIKSGCIVTLALVAFLICSFPVITSVSISPAVIKKKSPISTQKAVVRMASSEINEPENHHFMWGCQIQFRWQSIYIPPH